MSNTYMMFCVELVNLGSMTKVRGCTLISMHDPHNKCYEPIQQLSTLPMQSITLESVVNNLNRLMISLSINEFAFVYHSHR